MIFETFLNLDPIFDACRFGNNNVMQCYHLTVDAVSYSDAPTACPTGSSLAIVESQEEIQFIYDHYLQGELHLECIKVNVNRLHAVLNFSRKHVPYSLL